MPLESIHEQIDHMVPLGSIHMHTGHMVPLGSTHKNIGHMMTVENVHSDIEHMMHLTIECSVGFHLFKNDNQSQYIDQNDQISLKIVMYICGLDPFYNVPFN